jgi:hypothetical protein
MLGGKEARALKGEEQVALARGATAELASVETRGASSNVVGRTLFALGELLLVHAGVEDTDTSFDETLAGFINKGPTDGSNTYIEGESKGGLLDWHTEILDEGCGRA